MILTNIVKVIDPNHEQHGNVLVLDRVDRDKTELVCFEWKGEPFGRGQPRIHLALDQALYGHACIITQWLTHTPPCQTAHWLNRRKDANGKDRLHDEQGVYENESLVNEDFKPIHREYVRD